MHSKWTGSHILAYPWGKLCIELPLQSYKELRKTKIWILQTLPFGHYICIVRCKIFIIRLHNSFFIIHLRLLVFLSSKGLSLLESLLPCTRALTALSHHLAYLVSPNQTSFGFFVRELCHCQCLVLSRLVIWFPPSTESNLLHMNIPNPNLNRRTTCPNTLTDFFKVNPRFCCYLPPGPLSHISLLVTE